MDWLNLGLLEINLIFFHSLDLTTIFRKQREDEKSENVSTDPKLSFTDLDYDLDYESFQ